MKSTLLCIGLISLVARPVGVGQTWQELVTRADSLLHSDRVDTTQILGLIGQAEKEIRPLFGLRLAVTSPDPLLMSVRDTAAVRSFLNRVLNAKQRLLGADHPQIAELLYLRGCVFLNDASPSVGRALDILKKAGIVNATVGQLYMMQSGDLLWENKYAEAEELALLSVKILDSLLGPSAPELALPLSVLGTAYGFQGKHQGERAFRRALTIWEKQFGPDDPELFRFVHNVGLAYLGRGWLEGAEEMFERSVMLARRNPNHPMYSLGLLGLAILYIAQERYSEAAPLMKEGIALAEASSPPNSLLLLYFLNEQAKMLIQHDRKAEAETSLRRAIEAVEREYGADEDDLSAPLRTLADLYRDQGRMTEAGELYRRTMAIMEAKDPDNPERAAVFESFSMFHYLVGNAADALEDAESAYAIRKRNYEHGAVAMSERDALMYSQFLKQSSAHHVSLVLGTTRIDPDLREKEINVLLNMKGLAFDGAARYQWALSQKELPQVSSLVDSFRYIKGQISHLYVAESKVSDPRARKRSLDSLATILNNVEADLMTHIGDNRVALSEDGVSVQAITKHLRAEETLVEYVLYEHFPLAERPQFHYLVFTLSGKGDAYICDLGAAEPIDYLVQRYRKHFIRIAESGMALAPSDQAEYESIGKELYRFVWRPISDHVRKNTVFIAPDGGLNLISFGALVDDKGKYLIERQPIHYLSAGRDIIRLKQMPGERGRGLLAFGDPDYDAGADARLGESGVSAANVEEDAKSNTLRNLRSGCGKLSGMAIKRLPNTGIEARAIGKFWLEAQKDDPVQILLMSDASEENLKLQAPGKRVLHIATHGYYIHGDCEQKHLSVTFYGDPMYVGENPLLLSGLFLAGANLQGRDVEGMDGEDGILTALEVSTMDLRGTDLVVLSACETGLGEVRQGEGVYGLRRAFQMAGAKTIVSALWQISDLETVGMMKRLYSRQAKTYPDLLRAAALQKIHELRARNRPTHPYVWGAFIATGDWRFSMN